MRICLLASARFPVREPFMGGLEAHTHSLARALLNRGHEVSLFAAPGSDPELGVNRLPFQAFRSSRTARADVSAAPETWMQEHHAYLDLLLSLGRGEHGVFDVVHNNTLHHLPIAMSRMVPAPVLTTLHTPPLAWLESAMAFAAQGSACVAVSEHVSQAWRHVVTSRVVHNGVDTDAWRAGPGGGALFWSGRVVPEKAPHEAIEAALEAGLDIDVAGPLHDPGYFREHVQPLLGPTARYVGHLDRAELAERVGRARVVVVTPAWDEPFGLVAAEALSCGTPVVGYARGALPEVVDGATGLLVGPGDIGALAHAMRSAARLDRAAARDRACRLWGLDRMVTAYERVYADLARRRSAA